MSGRYSVIASLFVILLVLLFLSVVGPVSGISSLFQPSATAHQQTLDAIVADSLTQTATAYQLTQTAVVEDLYATAEAQLQPAPTSTPDPGIDASDRARAIEAYGAGWLLHWDEKYTAALIAFNMTIDLAPNWAEGYVGRGITYYKFGLYEEARDDFERAIELDPDDADLYGWHAGASYYLGENRDALASYERALALKPNVGVWYNNRGLVFTNLGRYDDAVADFDRAIELDPTEPNRFLNRRYHHNLNSEYGRINLTWYIGDGLQAFNDGNYSQAVEEFTQAINVEQYFDDYSLYFSYAYLNLGRTHIELENYDLAQAAFAEALRLNSDLTHAILGQGDVYARQGMWSEALDKYNKAITQRPSLPDSYLKRGMVYAAQGNHGAAAVDFWEWIQRNQTHDVAWDYFQFSQPFVMQIDTTWSYYIPVDGKAGQLFSASAKTLLVDSPVDPLLVLLDPDGNPVAANNDANPITLDAVLEDFVLPMDGAYTLVVSHAIGSDGPVEITLDRGPVLPDADITATAAAFTPTPTATLTPTTTLTSTPTLMPLPTATPDSAATQFEDLGTLYLDSSEQIGWQDDTTVVTFNGLSGIRAHSVVPVVGAPARTVVDDIDYPFSSAISPDGRLLVYAQEDVMVHDAETGARLTILQHHTAHVRSIVFTPDSAVFFTGDADGNIAVWDAVSFDLITSFTTDLIAAHKLVMDPNGTWLVIAEPFSGSIELWDISTPANPQKNFTLADHLQSPGGLGPDQIITISPDGSLLAGISGKDIILWDMTTFTQIATLSGHINEITCLDFNHDGTLLASGSEDKTIRLWYVPHRSQIAVLGGPQTNTEIESVHFSPGNDLLAAKYDGEIHIWGVRSALTEGLPTPTPTLPPTATIAPETLPESPSDAVGASTSVEVASAEQIEAARHLADGWDQVFEERFTQAVMAFDAGIDLMPDWAEPYLGRGVALHQAWDWSAARQDYEVVLAEVPNDFYTLSWLAALPSFGNEDETLALVSRIVDLSPYDAWGYNYRGVILTRMNRDADALVDFSKAIELAPTNKKHFADRQGAYEDLNQPNLALFDGYMSDGLDLFEQEDYAGAIAAFQQALSISTSTSADPAVYAYYNLALAYKEMGDTEQAISALNQAIALWSDYPYPYYTLGKIYADAGDYTTAVDFYTRAIENNAWFNLPYVYRALAYEELGQAERAAADYWQWIALIDRRLIDWPFFAPGESIPVAVHWGWTYRFPFAGQVGQTVRIQTEIVDPESGIDTIIAVADSAGQSLAVDNDGGANPHEDYLEMVLPSDGTYTLFLTHGVKSKGIARVRIDVLSDGLPATSSPAEVANTCEIRADEPVNLRTGPGTSFAVAGVLTAGQVIAVDGQLIGDCEKMPSLSFE